jgi:hypothetical protein
MQHSLNLAMRKILMFKALLRGDPLVTLNGYGPTDVQGYMAGSCTSHTAPYRESVFLIPKFLSRMA